MSKDQNTLSLKPDQRGKRNTGKRNNNKSNQRSKNAHENMLKDMHGGVIQLELMAGGTLTGKLINSDRYAVIVQPNVGQESEEGNKPVCVFKHAIASFY